MSLKAKSKSKVTTFRVKPAVERDFEILQNLLNLDKTEILNRAIASYKLQILKHQNSHPLQPYLGSIDETSADEILKSIKQNRKEQIKLQKNKDRELEKMFE